MFNGSMYYVLYLHIQRFCFVGQYTIRNQIKTGQGFGKKSDFRCRRKNQSTWRRPARSGMDQQPNSQSSWRWPSKWALHCFCLISYWISCICLFDCSVDAALRVFQAARPPGIYKAHYIIDLFERYGDKADAPPAPELPDWCYGKDHCLRSYSPIHETLLGVLHTEFSHLIISISYQLYFNIIIINVTTESRQLLPSLFPTSFCVYGDSHMLINSVPWMWRCNHPWLCSLG